MAEFVRFLAMDGHYFYVWGSWLASAIVLGFNWCAARRAESSARRLVRAWHAEQ